MFRSISSIFKYVFSNKAKNSFEISFWIQIFLIFLHCIFKATVVRKKTRVWKIFLAILVIRLISTIGIFNKKCDYSLDSRTVFAQHCFLFFNLFFRFHPNALAYFSYTNISWFSKDKQQFLSTLTFVENYHVLICP